MPDFKPKYEKDRPDDTNLFIGVSDKPGHLDLYGYGQGVSFDRNGNSHTKGYIPQRVEVKTLSEVFESNVEGQVVHFLKIDVENWEKKVLMGMDFSETV